MKNKKYLIIFLIFLLVSGCSSLSSKSEEKSYADMEQAPYSTNRSADSAMPGAMMFSESVVDSGNPSASSAGYQNAGKMERLIVRSGSLTIEVLDTKQALESISKIAVQLGGFVVQSNTWQETYYQSNTLPYGSITIRVAAENFDQAIEAIQANTPDPEKNVLSKVISGEDITSEYIDSTSRLSSLEATRTKLYEIMDTAATAEETLTVYKEISDIESQIEVLKGQIKYMEESAALSSISAEVHPIVPAKEVEVKEWSFTNIFNNAVQNLIDTAQNLGEWLIIFAVSVLPFLLIIFVPLFFIIRAIVRKSHKSKQNSTKNKEFDNLK